MHKVTEVVANIEGGLKEFGKLTDTKALPENIMKDVLTSLEHLQNEIDTIQLTLQHPRLEE